MLLHSGYGKEGRNCYVVFVHSPVRKNQDIGSFLIGTVRLYKYMVNCPFQGGVLIVYN